ncbi:hypothetical protein [Deinococcus multiflagellatus]|uniref:Uncharacterized protein n=1 Tax=Deinococcus multiflagellatus TaxID=1656887 RepID=A0ABW1ZIE4_9DEIO
MPLSAIRQVEVHDVLSSRELGPALVAWTAQVAAGPPTAPPGGPPWPRLGQEVRVALGEGGAALNVFAQQPLTAVTCPECQGVMARIEEGPLTRFRCHTGHAYTASALQAEVQRVVDHTLAAAQRALNEQAMLLQGLAQAAAQAGQPQEAARLRGENRPLWRAPRCCGALYRRGR